MTLRTTLRRASLMAALAALFVVPGVGAAGVPADHHGTFADVPLTLTDTTTDKVISVDDMVTKLNGYDGIFLGEFHDSQPVHDTELAVLQQLYAQHGDKLVLSMEMFERDVQPVVNDYLAGKITEEEFLKNSRPWPQYMMAYKPLIEFAKAHKIPVLAGNIPRYLAADYAKSGTLDSIPADKKQYLPRVHKAGSKAYEDKFAATMMAMNHAGVGMQVPPERIHNMFMAQCLKDDTMAESISDYMAAHPGVVIYHVQGEFHGESRLGVVEKLQGLQPQAKLAVIDTIHYDGTSDVQEITKEKKDFGDFLIFDTAHKG